MQSKARFFFYQTGESAYSIFSVTFITLKNFLLKTDINAFQRLKIKNVLIYLLHSKYIETDDDNIIFQVPTFLYIVV
jgi:hypothetical protein